MPGPRLLAANAKSRGNSLFSNPEVTPWPRKQFLPPTGSRCRILEYVRTNIIRFAIRNSFGKTKCRKRHLVFFSNIIVVFHQMVKFHCLVKILINGNLFMESCKSNLQTMEYYKISENLKYACLRSKIQSIKTHPYAVNLHKLIKTLSTPDSDINLAFLVALGLESKSENGVLQQQVLLCLVFQVLPDISHCEVPHIFNEAKLNIYQWTNSIISNLNSFLPPILHICHRNSLTKLILITQLNQLAVTHSTHPNHTTQPTPKTHPNHSSHKTNRHSLNSS